MDATVLFEFLTLVPEECQPIKLTEFLKQSSDVCPKSHFQKKAEKGWKVLV